MSGNRVKVTCPYCKHEFWVDLKEIGQEGPPIFKFEVDTGAAKKADYRATCDNCDKKFVIGVPE